jgi:hypothetical protein
LIHGVWTDVSESVEAPTTATWHQPLSKPCYAGYMYQTIMPHFPLFSSQQHATTLSMTGTSSTARVRDLLRACLSASPDRTDHRDPLRNRTHTSSASIPPPSPSMLLMVSRGCFSLSRTDKHLPCRQPQAEPAPRNLHAGKAEDHFARFPSWTIA